MARIHPEDIEGLESATEGERKVFQFLWEAARPDSDFIGWYEPAIGEQGKEPDFVPSVDFPDIKKKKRSKEKIFLKGLFGPFFIPGGSYETGIDNHPDFCDAHPRISLINNVCKKDYYMIQSAKITLSRFLDNGQGEITIY